MVTSTVDVPRHSSVVVGAKRAADYYRNTNAVATGRRNGWSWATYFDVQPLIPSATLAPMDARMSGDLTGLPVAQYYWIDALYVEMANWSRWAVLTGNSTHLDKMHALSADLEQRDQQCDRLHRPDSSPVRRG